MLKESLKDAGEILSTILHQPLTVAESNSHSMTSLYSAAVEYLKESPLYSDLSRVLQNFVKYPESTRNLLMELDLICADLESKY